MKYQTSISVDEEVMLKIKEELRDGSFRSQSHLFEFAVKKIFGG
ncbi:MAG: hypothetical protein QXG00_04905 [Candidatus Woesearchaeota archaeon]